MRGCDHDDTADGLRRQLLILIRAFAVGDGCDGEGEDADVAAEGEGFDVFAFDGEAFLEGELASRDLVCLSLGLHPRPGSRCFAGRFCLQSRLEGKEEVRPTRPPHALPSG